MQRIERVHLALAVRAERREVLTQAVLEAGGAGADARAIRPERNHVRKAAELHALVGDEAAEAEEVAVAGEIAGVQVDADAVLPAEAVAVVVRVDVAVEVFL